MSLDLFTEAESLNVRGLLVMSSGFANKPLETLFLSCVIKTAALNHSKILASSGSLWRAGDDCHSGPEALIIIIIIIIIRDRRLIESVLWRVCVKFCSDRGGRLIEEPRISLVWDCWWFVWERDVRRPQIQSDQILKKLINLQKLRFLLRTISWASVSHCFLWKTAYISAL